MTGQEMNDGFQYENKNFPENVLVYPHMGPRDSSPVNEFLKNYLVPGETVEVFFDQDYGFDFDVINKQANIVKEFWVNAIERVSLSKNNSSRFVIKC